GWFMFSSRRRHTRLVSDWSSDVCSSDLAAEPAGAGALPWRAPARDPGAEGGAADEGRLPQWKERRRGDGGGAAEDRGAAGEGAQIGRASCRERGGIAVRAAEMENEDAER